MKSFKLFVTLLSLFVCLPPVNPGCVMAQGIGSNVLEKVGIDQRLNQQVPLNLVFRDEAGKEIQLRDYFDGRPVVLVLAYYQCPMLCTEVLNGLVKSLQHVGFAIDRQYRVITVSFDPTETPDLAAAKKASYVRDFGQPGAETGWHFLTGEEASVKALTDAVGFRYVYDPVQKQFAHASGIFVLTPDGKLARYFFGIDYPPRDLRLALLEASQGKIGSATDGLLLLCYHYDETTGRYTPSVMNFIRLGGLVTLLAVGTLVGIACLRERKLKSQKLKSVSIYSASD